jgi:hypothetical protein
MTKKKRRGETGAAPAQDNSQEPAETVSGYFRTVFAEQPQWLDSRSNDQLLVRWLKDHPGQTEVPEKVRQNLSNIKSVLRKQARKAGGPRRGSPAARTNSATAAAPRKAVGGLDALEEQIDECLTLARNLDREGLAGVIGLLRRARNEVVWKMGETTDR